MFGLGKNILFLNITFFSRCYHLLPNEDPDGCSRWTTRSSEPGGSSPIPDQDGTQQQQTNPTPCRIKLEQIVHTLLERSSDSATISMGFTAKPARKDRLLSRTQLVIVISPVCRWAVVSLVDHRKLSWVPWKPRSFCTENNLLWISNLLDVEVCGGWGVGGRSVLAIHLKQTFYWHIWYFSSHYWGWL